MRSYLTKQEAEDRLLAAYGIDTSLGPGHVESASRWLGSRGPFLGVKYASSQPLAFPRTYLRDGDVAGQVPEAVLDAVAARAYLVSEPDEPGVTSSSVQHLGSKTYARPKLSRGEQLMMDVMLGLEPYLRTRGSLG
jgi:hypothetical protein